jgi:hypothetical protein
MKDKIEEMNGQLTDAMATIEKNEKEIVTKNREISR